MEICFEMCPTDTKIAWGVWRGIITREQIGHVLSRAFFPLPSKQDCHEGHPERNKVLGSVYMGKKSYPLKVGHPPSRVNFSERL